ncbi:MAG: CHAT domain-containing protein [Ekhidna sp.]
MRLFTTLLLLLVASQLISQSFPERPNAYSADSLRIGEWITFYDSLGEEVTRDSLNISHYCLMEINRGKPFGQIECFYENGIRSWTGRMISIDPEIKQGIALGYHKNGTLWSRAFYENDTIQGTYTSYHDNGILETEGEMVDGRKVGEWTFFYENGNPIGTIGYVNGQEDGEVLIFYDNGKINSKGKIANDLSQGYWEVFYKSGVLANKGHYEDGKRYGKWTYYHENGKEKEVAFYKNDVENGAASYYFENGNLQSQGTYENGLGEGNWKYYHENGQLSSEGLLKKGLYQGTWVDFYANDQKESEGNYTDDKKDGLWVYYFDNGQYNREVNWKMDKENGPIIYYYDNGVLNAQGEYVDGVKHGKWEYYLTNGALQGIENYKHGVQHGYKEYRNTEGKLVNRGSYIEDKRNGVWEFFYENGQMSSSEMYEDGVSQGPVTAFYENGQMKREGSYLNDVREGLWKFYYSNGQLSAIGDYKEGNSTGTWKYYFDNGAKKSEGQEFADKKFGEWNFYRRNGNLKSKEPYVNGQAHGMLTFYDTLGNFKSKERYINGVGQTFSTFYDSTNNLASNGKFELAEQTLQAAEKAYYEAFSKDGLKKTDLYELHALFYRKKGDYKKAIKYMKKALNHVLKFKSDTSIWYTATLDDLADVYTDMEDHENANLTYERVLAKIKERPYGIRSKEYANAVRFHAITLMNLNRHAEAIKLLEADLEFRKTLPNQNINIAASYVNIIDAHYPNLSPELDTAIEKSIAFHKQNKLLERWSYSNSFYFKALVQRDRNQRDSAYASFNSYVELNSQIKDTVSVRFANALINLGNYHYSKLEYDQSRPFYNRAMLLAENSIIKNSWVYMSALVCISNQFWADRDYENTLLYNKRILSLALPKSDTSRIGQAYSGIALAYDNMGIEYIKKARENHLKSIQELSKYKKYNTHYINSNLHYANHLEQNDLDNDQYNLLLEIKDQLISFEKIDSFHLYRVYLSLADNFYHTYKYDSALIYASKIIEELKEKPGKSLQQYLHAYRTAGNVYSDKNDNENANTYYLSVLSETEKYLGKENDFYAFALQDIADNFADANNHTSAILYYEQAIEIEESRKGEWTALDTRIDYAEELISLDKYDSALSLLNGIQQAYINLDQEYTDDYISCLKIKSRALERLNKIQNAENELLKGLDIIEEMYSYDNIGYASYIRRLGQFYLRNNEPELAYQYVAPAIDIIKSTYGDEETIYAWYAETVSEVLYNLDNSAEAVNLLEKAISIYQAKIGEEQDYMNASYDLGQILASIGQYEKSIDVLNKERNAVRKKHGRYSHSYASRTREIARTYLLWNKNLEGLKELEMAKNIYDTIGAESSYYARIYNFMGWALLDLGQWEEGKRYNELAIQIADSLWGKGSESSIVYKSNLAFFYLQNGNFSEAERLWIESESKSFVSDLERVDWLDNMATLYTSWGKLEKAEPYWNQINDLLLNAIKRDFPLLSEQGKAAFWDSYRKDFEIYNTFAVSAYQGGNAQAIRQMYDNQLQTKSLLLNSTTKERKRILNSENKALLNTYNKYVSLKEDLAKYYGFTSAELTDQSIDISALESQAESLEKALSINSDDEKKARNERNLTWKSIQRTLLPNEAAIEIIRYRHFNKVTTDSVIYAALILTSNTKEEPIIEVIPNGNYLEDRAIKAYRSSMKFKIDDKRSYTAFWSAIDQHLDGVKNVYLSSDGVYHQLNIATLQDEQGNFINEKYDTRLVSSTRTISELKKKTRSNQSQTAYIFGNPKFDLSHTLIEGDLKERGLSTTQSFTRATNFDDFSFSELPGTKVETETVNDVLTKNAWTTNLYLGENALEEELKRVDNPSILHIATHGFFLDQPDESKNEIQLGVQAEASRKNALLRSGLLMTGATQTAKGEQNNSIENGIFTAYEAMNLNLSSTELVILSACETGLGEIKNGEGVFGLQRAFQIAGAKSILMSLWKVDDAATQLLMTSFYDAWLNGADEVTALHQAQEVVKAEYPHPNYWGAFVLVGG